MVICKEKCKLNKGKYSYGRMLIEMDPSRVGKKAAVFMLMLPKEE